MWIRFQALAGRLLLSFMSLFFAYCMITNRECLFIESYSTINILQPIFFEISIVSCFIGKLHENLVRKTYFVKHQLKGVLKCIKVKLGPAPSDHDRHFSDNPSQTMTDVALETLETMSDIPTKPKYTEELI